MKTIIHIGQHKTGTTSLQTCLETNKERLGQQGIYVVSKILDHVSPSHYLLNIYALAADRFSSAKDALLSTNGKSYLNWLDDSLPAEIERIYEVAAKKKCDKIIWSNEGLYLLNSISEYKKLRNLFEPFSDEISVVCSFREKKSFRRSYQNQLLKQNISPEEDQNSYRYTNKNSWLFDYKHKKSLLETIFDRCYFFDYNPDNNTKAFFEELSIPFVDLKEFRLNISPRKSTFTKLFFRNT